MLPTAECSKVPRQLRAEKLALFYLLQETQTVASPQVPVVRQPEKFGCLEHTSAVSQSYQLQRDNSQSTGPCGECGQPARELWLLGTYIFCFPVIPAARCRDDSQSTGPCGQPARVIQLLGTYIFCFSVIPAARYRDGSQSTGPCGQTAREIQLLGTYIFCFSVIQHSSHLTIEREPVGTAQVNSDLNKLSAEAAAVHSSSLSEDCEVSDIVCAHCLKKEDRQNYVAVQAVKASVIVTTSARYPIGPHISSCANLSNL